MIVMDDRRESTKVSAVLCRRRHESELTVTGGEGFHETLALATRLACAVYQERSSRLDTSCLSLRSRLKLSQPFRKNISVASRLKALFCLMSSPLCREIIGSHMNHISLFISWQFGHVHASIGQCKEGMITSDTDIVPCAKLLASLPHQNTSRSGKLIGPHFDSKTTSSRVAAIIGGTSCLFGRHGSTGAGHVTQHETAGSTAQRRLGKNRKHNTAR